MVEFTDKEAVLLREHLDISQKALKLCSDLLDPEMYGHAVTAEVRNRAREVIGINTREPE